MGQYSLEHYERYPTVKCRPKETTGIPQNPGRGVFQTITCSWKETEPQRGAFYLEPLREKLAGCPSVVLELETTPPDWAAQAAPQAGAALAESWLRRIAAELDGGKPLFAVTLQSAEEGGVSSALLDALFEAFDLTWKLLPVTGEREIAQARRRGFRFGLLAELGAQPFDCCDSFARYGLQQIWEQAPVLVRGCGAAIEQTEKLARQWHACAVEQGSAGEAAGYRLALRRLTYPASLTAGGVIPLRFWWANSGQSPCYLSSRVRLCLRRGGETHPIPLGDAPERWPVGDRVWNEIARLPNVPAGEYELLCGVFDRFGKPLRLAMEGEASEGFYSVGTVALDAVPRAELEQAWDGYYPEGYYPLEDPAVPGSE